MEQQIISSAFRRILSGTTYFLTYNRNVDSRIHPTIKSFDYDIPYCHPAILNVCRFTSHTLSLFQASILNLLSFIGRFIQLEHALKLRL